MSWLAILHASFHVLYCIVGAHFFSSDMRDAKKALQEGQSPYEDLYKRGKVCTRAKETLEKAKDCISKELVWKVRTRAKRKTKTELVRPSPRGSRLGLGSGLWLGARMGDERTKKQFEV